MPSLRAKPTRARQAGIARRRWRTRRDGATECRGCHLGRARRRARRSERIGRSPSRSRRRAPRNPTRPIAGPRTSSSRPRPSAVKVSNRASLPAARSLKRDAVDEDQSCDWPRRRGCRTWVCAPWPPVATPTRRARGGAGRWPAASRAPRSAARRTTVTEAARFVAPRPARATAVTTIVRRRIGRLGRASQAWRG